MCVEINTHIQQLYMSVHKHTTSQTSQKALKTIDSLDQPHFFVELLFQQSKWYQRTNTTFTVYNEHFFHITISKDTCSFHWGEHQRNLLLVLAKLKKTLLCSACLLSNNVCMCFPLLCVCICLHVCVCGLDPRRSFRIQVPSLVRLCSVWSVAQGKV